MSFKEVKELRKNENLDDALKMALSDLENNPNDIWNKRSVAWVYYEFIKKNALPENFDIFISYIQKLNELSLPEDEKMIFDNCAFQIGSFLFSLNKVDNPDIRKVTKLFEQIQQFHYTKPSEAYTFLFKAFQRYNKIWQRYIDFANWWNFENFRSEDFLEEEFKGRKIMSIVEQAFIAYAKKLLEGDTVIENNFILPKSINKDKISAFLTSLDGLIKKHPEYQYPQYFKAKLLLAVGDKENVLSAFIPFAKKKKNDFWTWELMSEVFPKSDTRKMACLCKALSLHTQESFLINTRQKLAELLIESKNYNEAKTEITKVIEVKKKNDWKIKNKISNWITQDWYKNAKASNNNQNFYTQYLKDAELILFSDVPEQIVAVEFVNKGKHILNFVRNREIHGYFKYKGLFKHPKIGDILKVRFEQNPKDNFYRALTVEKANKDEVCEAISKFSGKISINKNFSFGFADNVYIDKKLISQNKIENNQLIYGLAILSYNNKKKGWGLKAIEIFSK